MVTQISLRSPNLFNRFSWDRGLAPLGGQAAKNRFVTLKRSRLSCKLLHMQLGIKKYTWVVGKKTKTFYKNLNIGRSSVRVNVYQEPQTHMQNRFLLFLSLKELPGRICQSKLPYSQFLPTFFSIFCLAIND